MAAVLREIAPDCEIFALNISHDSEEKRVKTIVEAIEFAIEQKLDVLTLSQGEITGELRVQLDDAVNRAVENGIVTTFIHYDNPQNLLPYSTTPYGGDYGREPDINVFHYNYNSVRPIQLLAYEKRTTPPESGDDMPYFSYSAMSPVTAGFVAILKSIDNTLTPQEYKQLLMETSYSFTYDGEMDWEDGVSPHTVDIHKAAQALKAKVR